MKVGVFYRDAFQSGGVPGEVREIANALATRHEVFYWGRSGVIPDTLDPGVSVFPYPGLRELCRAFPQWLKETRPELLLLVGLFQHDNLLAASAARRHGRRHPISVVLNPLAQMTEMVFAGKIFSANPDVRALEEMGYQLPRVRETLMGHASRFVKQVYLNSIGRMIIEKSDRVAVFSYFEAQQFMSCVPFPQEHFVRLRWGLDQVSAEADQRHHYRDVLGYTDGKANYVYWGRLDWYYKGIDRLLEGVLECRRENADLPFRLFLMGPDYQGGVEKIQAFIHTHRLDDVIHLMLPGSYPAGSKTPLRDACAAVYPSRWDGFPRTLREATLLNVPVLVSPETHFGELVSEFNSGITLQNPDDPQEMAQALMALADGGRQSAFRFGAARLAPELSWQKATQTLIEDCERIVSDVSNHRVGPP